MSLKITLFILTLLLFAKTSSGQYSEVVEQLSESTLKAFSDLNPAEIRGTIRLFVDLQDSMDLNFDQFPNLLELNIRSSYNNYNTYDQLKGLDGLRVLSFRPTSGMCKSQDDTDPCIMVQHRIFPNEFSFPKNLLILDAASPFIQRIPDRVISRCSDLRILMLRRMRYADLPVELVKMNGLNQVIVEESTILMAEKIFFEKYAPSMRLIFGKPEWLLHGEINYTHKTVRRALLKKVKLRKSPKDGDFTLYFKSGGIAIKGSFSSGHPSGNWELYNASGVVVRERSYGKDGSRTGTWQWFNDSGLLIYDESYASGVRVSSREYVILDSVSTALFKSQRFDGTNKVEVKTYFPDGTLASEYGLWGSHYHGPKKEYYPNGQLKSEMHYNYDINSYSPASMNYDYSGQLLRKIERISLESAEVDSLQTFLTQQGVTFPTSSFQLRKTTVMTEEGQLSSDGYTFLYDNDTQLSISNSYRNEGNSTVLWQTTILMGTSVLKAISY